MFSENKKVAFSRIILLICVVIMVSFLLAPHQTIIRAADGNGQKDPFGKSGLYGLDPVAKETGFKTGEKAPQPEQVIGNIVGIALSFVGGIFLIVVIFGGIMWMTAGGNEEKIKKARGIIVNGILGIIIVFAAYALTYFVVQQLAQQAGVQ